LGGPLIHRLGVPIAATVGWIAGLALAWLSWKNAVHRRIAMTLWAAFALLMIATMARFGGPGDLLFHTELGDRYFYIPLVLLAWLVICALRPWPWIAAT